MTDCNLDVAPGTWTKIGAQRTSHRIGRRGGCCNLPNPLPWGPYYPPIRPPAFSDRQPGVVASRRVCQSEEGMQYARISPTPTASCRRCSCRRCSCRLEVLIVNQAASSPGGNTSAWRTRNAHQAGAISRAQAGAQTNRLASPSSVRSPHCSHSYSSRIFRFIRLNYPHWAPLTDSTSRNKLLRCALTVLISGPCRPRQATSMVEGSHYHLALFSFGLEVPTLDAVEVGERVPSQREGTLLSRRLGTTVPGTRRYARANRDIAPQRISGSQDWHRDAAHQPLSDLSLNSPRLRAFLKE